MADARNLAAARDGWADGPPDWVTALATACDRQTQTAVARALGISASAVNAVIRGRYGASTDRVESLVRGRLMAGTVACPELGSLAADLCREWQGRVRAPAPNAFGRRMAAACRGCPISRLKETSA